MSSLKLVLISTGVLSAAIMLRLSAPAMADFAESLPSIYNDVVSWLRPPYLYLIINCIIITIVASSKLQSRKDVDVSPSPAATQPLDTMSADILNPQPVSVKSIPTDYEPYKYNGVVLSDSSGYEVEAEKGLPEIDTYEQVDAKIQTAPFVACAADGGVSFFADAMSNKENEYVIAKSTWTVPDNKGSMENSPSNVKPPASKRFGHRRNVKASPEAGIKTVLGVSKPKKQDTLESTWRTITEGRAMPINRHLKKSDTWERDNHHLQGRRRQQQQQQQEESNKTPQKTMTKAETFNDRTNTRSSSPGSSDGSGKIRREASLSSDELNRRVEAFIKKFNEDMRLQRQESLNQYNEMVRRV
ncbi:hypothetical protein CASFOL_008018 [Castilleja foliolosa]|uniref:DUF4408 domain-containing protein n=1 Tax=Castilleja foliolosa TaxID=1961234 RepID=A0ABD3E1R1_9LAMI